MTPFIVYKLYLALRLHFTSDRYDIVKMKGRVQASEQSFARRNDLVGVRRLARKYTVPEVTNFMVANFVQGDTGGGMFTIGSEAVYRKWLTRMEKLPYYYKDELQSFFEEQKSIKAAFDCKHGHPPILKAYLNGTVSIETLVILNRVLPFTDTLSKYLGNDVIWPDIKRLITKYTPFVKIDKHKYSTITYNVISNLFPEKESSESETPTR